MISATNPYAEATPTRLLRLGIGLTIMIVAVGAGLLHGGGHINTVIMPTSFFFVLTGPLVAFLAAGIPPPIGTIARSAFASMRFASMAQAAIYVSVLGNVIGLIHVMENLDKPNAIGPGVAVAFVVNVYGAIAWAILRALSHNSALGAMETHESLPLSERDSEAMLGSLTAAVVLLLAVFVVLYAIQLANPSPN